MPMHMYVSWLPFIFKKGELRLWEGKMPFQSQVLPKVEAELMLHEGSPVE